MIKEINTDLAYRYNGAFMTEFEVTLAEVFLLKVPDSFINRISGTSEEESHVNIGDIR